MPETVSHDPAQGDHHVAERDDGGHDNATAGVAEVTRAAVMRWIHDGHPKQQHDVRMFHFLLRLYIFSLMSCFYFLQLNFEGLA